MQAGESEGALPSPFSIYHHVQSSRYISPISSLHLYTLQWLGVSMTLPMISSPVPLISATNIVSIMSLITMTYLSPVLVTPHEKIENNSSPVSTTKMEIINFFKNVLQIFRDTVPLMTVNTT